MPKAVLPDLAVVLTFLRSGLGWSQVELGEAASVSPSLLNDYEHGRKDLKRDRLEHLISFMGLGPEEIDATLERLNANRAAAKVPGGAEGLSPARRGIEAAAARAGRLAAEFVRSALSIVSWEAEALQAREAARRLWPRLERRTSEERTALVEGSKKFRGWALSELAAAKSIEKAPSSPAEALELAMLALRIAELSPGEKWLRERAQGNAWFHVANARRVINDLRGSDLALATATRHWEAGASGDPGLFSEATVLALAASIRRSQRRFPEALRRIEEALAALRMFCEAAGRESATVELTRSVLLFLHRSQHDPELKFESAEEAVAP
jgi:transcriptional regulator with XRE-family HTH domain